MDWQRIIKDLNDKGIPNAKIFKHTGISYKQLNRLRDGKQKDVLHAKGIKLEDLADLFGIQTRDSAFTCDNCYNETMEARERYEAKENNHED